MNKNESNNIINSKDILPEKDRFSDLALTLAGRRENLYHKALLHCEQENESLKKENEKCKIALDFCSSCGVANLQLIESLRNEIDDLNTKKLEYSEALKIVKEYDEKQQKILDENLRLFKLELTKYFEDNLIAGRKIFSFSLQSSFGSNNFDIIPTPSLEECYDGENNEDIKNIADKHNIKASFVYWMYHK